MDDEDEQSALMNSVHIDMPIHTNSNTVSLNPGIFKNYKKNINTIDIIIISVIIIAIIITIIYILV